MNVIRFLLFWGMVVACLAVASARGQQTSASETEPMSKKRALQILNDSPWARQQTDTRLIEGVGSGEYGEKEIFSRYYVRILSAAPVREAFERVWNVVRQETAVADNPETTAAQKAWSNVDAAYIVIAVAFRSNEPEQQRNIDRTMRSQTLDTIRNRAYLSTQAFPQLQPVAFYPPLEPAVGSEFVFPRYVDGVEVISKSDDSFTFEFNLPTRGPDVRVTFPVTPEVLAGAPPSAKRPSEEEKGIEEFRVTSVSGTRKLDLQSSRLAAVTNQFPQQTTTRIFHGSLYEFHRNDNFDARNFFDPVGQPLPEYKRNQFGLSMNLNLGPKISLFGSYDGLRINQGSTLLSHVPTEAMKQGDFGQLLELDSPVIIRDPDTGEPFPGNRIPASRINPAAAELLSLIPDPNRSERVRNFVNSQPVLVNHDSVNVRADLALSDISQLTAQYAMDLGSETAVHPLPAFGSRATEDDYEASASYTRVFSETTTAHWRFWYRRNLDNVVPRQDRPQGLVESLGIAGLSVSTPEDEGYPVFDLAGYPQFGDAELPQNEVRNRGAVESNLTIVRGDHVLHFDGEAGLRQINDSRSSSLERGSFSFSGTYSGDAFADFLLGRADQALRAVGSSRQDLRRRHFRVGVVDEWRIDPRFSLRLGLDYLYFQPYRSIRNNLSVFRPLRVETPPDGELIDLEEGSRASVQTVVQPDRNDFSPEIGLAYRPFESGRTVVRVSYGLHYDPFPSWIFENFMGRNYPYYYLQEAQASVDSNGLSLSTPFNTATATELAVRDIYPQLSTPYSQSWRLELENSLSNVWSFNVEYFGRRGVHELRIIPGNVPRPNPGPLQPRRPNTDYGQFSIVSGGGSSIQHRLGAEIQRRFARGLSFQAEFDWGRRFDDDFEGDPANPRNLRAEWAPTGWYEDKRLSVHFIVDLPFGPGHRFGGNRFFDAALGGWRLSGIGEIESGGPFTIVLPGDANNDGLFGDRPDGIGSASLPSSEQSVDRWFDTGAFAEPAAYTFGSLGRNTVLGPGYHNWDLSLIKDIQFTNDHRLEFRFAFFNAFNHPNFENPDPTFGTVSFGVISGARRAREIEIAVKYSF